VVQTLVQRSGDAELGPCDCVEVGRWRQRLWPRDRWIASGTSSTSWAIKRVLMIASAGTLSTRRRVGVAQYQLGCSRRSNDATGLRQVGSDGSLQPAVDEFVIRQSDFSGLMTTQMTNEPHLYSSFRSNLPCGENSN
jgi:hypothetical protein